jgi:hypothetical protein
LPTACLAEAVDDFLDRMLALDPDQLQVVPTLGFVLQDDLSASGLRALRSRYLSLLALFGDREGQALLVLAAAAGGKGAGEQGARDEASGDSG